MDEMKIQSKFLTAIISKIIKAVLKKKLGYNINFQLNQIHTTMIDEKMHVHLDLDGELGKEELTKIIKDIGIV